MGYLSIPKINIKLSIYHGTGDEVLQTGVGHLNGTKLPIGGESTHSVLAAHRDCQAPGCLLISISWKRGICFTFMYWMKPWPTR